MFPGEKGNSFLACGGVYLADVPSSLCVFVPRKQSLWLTLEQITRSSCRPPVGSGSLVLSSRTVTVQERGIGQCVPVPRVGP